MNKTPFGRRLSQLREDRGLTQEELAARLQSAGFALASQQEISNWEIRPNRRLYPLAFEALRRVLGLDLEEARELAVLWAYSATL